MCEDVGIVELMHIILLWVDGSQRGGAALSVVGWSDHARIVRGALSGSVACCERCIILCLSACMGTWLNQSRPVGRCPGFA